MTMSSHPSALELRDVPASEPWDTVRRGSRLMSRKVGLIRQVIESGYQEQDPAIFTTGLLLSDIGKQLNGGRSIGASGAGDSAAAALVAAIGEAAERHSCTMYDRDAMVFGAFEDLGDVAVSPDVLRLYSREQCARFARGPVYFDERTRVRWVWGYSLTDERPRLVPASLVYINYRPGEGEADIGSNASTGLAAGATTEEAILSGLLEAVERDAFTLAWMHRQPGRRVDVDDDALVDVMRTRLMSDRASIDVRLYDLTTDIGIPVIFGIMRRQAEIGPVPCQGLAARLSPVRAARKAIHEVGQNFPFIRNLFTTEKNWRPAPDFSNVTNFDYHFLTYLRRPELIPQALAFFDACDERVALSAMPDRSTGRILGDIESAVARLRALGHETIVVDVTSDDVAEAGLAVVRVVVPGLAPLHGNHVRPYLGVRRLVDAAARLGWPLDRGLNPMPHTFP